MRSRDTSEIVPPEGKLGLLLERETVAASLISAEESPADLWTLRSFSKLCGRNTQLFASLRRCMGQDPKFVPLPKAG